jgi:hypothetical protein
MSVAIADIRQRLAELGARIDAKVRELSEQGVLHGEARKRAVELQIEHARVVKSANEHPPGLRGVMAAELATDAEILSHSFDRWVAQIDGESERRSRHS